MKRRLWLAALSPARMEEERAKALQDSAKAAWLAAKGADQRRRDVEQHAHELSGLLHEALDGVKGVDHVGQDVRAVGMEVQDVGRKVDSMHESVDAFLAQAAAGAFGPGVQDQLGQALAAAQSVDMVGHDVRQLTKEVEVLRDWMIGLLEGEQKPAPVGRHRKTDGGGQQAAGPEAEEQEVTGTGAAPEKTGPGPDEERWLW